MVHLDDPATNEWALQRLVALLTGRILNNMLKMKSKGGSAWGMDVGG